MVREELLEKLRSTEKMDPDEHDGSYELMQSIVGFYTNVC